MNLGTIWLRMAIWNAIAVLRGSLDSSVMMVVVMAVMMDDYDDGDDGRPAGARMIKKIKSTHTKSTRSFGTAVWGIGEHAACHVRFRSVRSCFIPLL